MFLKKIGKKYIFIPNRFRTYTPSLSDTLNTLPIIELLMKGRVNMTARKTFKTTKSGFRGVWYDRNYPNKPWRTQIQWHGKLVKRGYFKTPAEAALAYDRLAEAAHGQAAILNFPELA
jgi:hypothetical protein